MPLFLSDEELERCRHDASMVSEKADAFIRELYNQLDTVKAQADAAAITAEQTCSLLEQKYVSLSSDFNNLESQNLQLNSALEQRLSELAQVQADKHQIQLKSIGKDGEIERLSMEASEFHKSKRQLIELLEQKDLDISEKNATMKSYLDKIVNLTDNAALRAAQLSDVEAELARSHASSSRLSQEKELIERHNAWLNDELTAKVNSYMELHKKHTELEADMSAKLADVERKLNESSSSLKWNKERAAELEMKLTSLQEELCSSKDDAAANEQRFSAEISTVTKLVELYKESSEEWSKKSGELEGVIKALETHLSQVENDYKERLEKEVSARKEFEKEATYLKEKLDKCEAEVEAGRKTNELHLLPLSSFTTETWLDSVDRNDMGEDNRMLVPNIPLGISGTALAASLLRDGWSLAKMYAKYQETVDALRHEQLGRKQSQAILERVLYEIEEKAGVILDERAEHERLVEAYSLVNQKLQHSLSEQATLERTIQDLKVDLKRHEREYTVAQKEIIDLQKQVTVLLKECRDIQLRCGSVGQGYADDVTAVLAVEINTDSDAEKVISDLTFKDINGLVEQNAQLRSLVRCLSDQIENRESELKEKFETEIQKHTDEAACKVNAILARAEEQARMIESLHTSVAMYKRLYEEEHKLHMLHPRSAEAAPEDGRKDFLLLLEGSQEATKNSQEKSQERMRCLEEDLSKKRSEIISLRSERDKLSIEANFANEKLERFMKEFEHQREETNGVIARNVEFSQLIVDYQRKLREGSDSMHRAEELSRKLTMEVSVLKHEKEMLSNSEKRAFDEVRSLSERVHRLQASLDTIQSAEEVREEARGAEKRKQEEYIKQIEREWVEAKKELQEQRDNVRSLSLDRENTMKNAMRQVEEMGKELANALHSFAAAESRAAVAEARFSDLEKKIKSSEIKISNNDGECGTSSFPTNKAIAELQTTKEEIEKLREDIQVNKDHMQQYKSIAEVNEAALKQMELAHENFKMEADKLKKSLEAEIVSLRNHVNELESDCILKSKEAVSAAAGKEEAVASALSEISSLKEESSVKTSQIAAMEIQFSSLKEDLEMEHRKWRASQSNYERQVILQSETIQELTKTSQALASLQEEASELRKLVDMLKTENNELKVKLEVEKSVLEKSKNEAVKKCDEIDEQNKILHSRLEALHIKLAEKERDSAGISSRSTTQNAVDDAGLQDVVNYLRRSKEIAETEISLLKQEKLRLQSQFESALKTAETAQASLIDVQVNSRALLYTEEEFKSLQLQVTEMNLLRESNMQLREENKHNFEEQQKLREIAQKTRIETENLERLLRERDTEVEAYKKDIEMQKMEKDHLGKRVVELVEKCKNIDVEEYERLREDVQRMQVNLRQKDAQLEEVNILMSEKQEVISQLEQDLAKSRIELIERENRINEILQVEASLKSELEKQKKFVAQLKKKCENLSKEKENLSKEKEELSRENHGLSKQLEESRQGKRGMGDTVVEQAMKEKEKEKDTRIQILEKTLERHREELKKEKDEVKMLRVRRQKTEKAIVDSIGNVNQEKTKLADEVEKHKQALKRLSDEVERLKHAKSNLPEGTSVVQLLSGTQLDDLAGAYIQAVENFERIAQSVSSELGASTCTDTSSTVDAPSLGTKTGQEVSPLAPSILPSAAPPSTFPLVKATEGREKKFILPKSSVETRKTGRKLVRPRIVKPEEPQGDTEMSEIEGSNNMGKPIPSLNLETQGNITLLTQPSVRKRLASSSTSELQEESLIQRGTSSDVGLPVLKKAKGPDSPQDSVEVQPDAIMETTETLHVTEESVDAVGDLPQDSNDEGIDAEKDEVEATGEQLDEEPSQVVLQNDRSDVLEENLDKPSEAEVLFDDGSKVQADQDIKMSMVESGSEREEGELLPDNTGLEVGGNISNIVESPENGGGESELAAAPVSSPGVDDEALVVATLEFGEGSSSQVLNDERTDEGDAEVNVETSEKSNDGNDQVVVESDQIPEAALEVGEVTPTVPAVEVDVPKQASPSVTADTEEVRQVSPVSRRSTTINLQERAKQRSLLRQAGVVSSSASASASASPSLGRGRGRTVRGRSGRGGRGGRGQSSGDQG
ncbi:nuclear-pore anchor isoform X2 [Cornus florida]|uniref:nuclear-pore anchor isoform X2 n=1 Tax=Cornus florida TaxID=4283 RepID=UPI00289ADA13|nr:nuclear-pore anchor isoform X2 [Cornus florida]